MAKSLPAMQETQVRFLGLLEKEMATHSSILVWKIPWTEEPGRLQSMGSQRVRHFPFTFLGLYVFTAEGLGSILELGKSPGAGGMVTHYSTLAWRIPWTEEPGRLQSMGSQRVGHD